VKKIITLSFICVASVFSCQEKTDAIVLDETLGVIQLLSVEEFVTHIKDKEVQLIDVRTEKEFTEKHIEKAKNFDIQSEKFNELVLTLDKNEAVYLYCRSGKRSKKASVELQKLGFKKIYDLKGGFLAWREN